jgi:hypothetical protein
MRTDRFEETKSVIGGIAYPANKYGKAIYEAAWTGQARAFANGSIRREGSPLSPSPHPSRRRPLRLRAAADAA